MLRRASVPLPVSGFGLELLEAQAHRCGLALDEFLSRAAERYFAERNPKLPSSRVPRFLKGGEPRVGNRTVEVEIAPDLWTQLERDADAQDVPLEVIVTHAGLWLAAKLET